MAWFTGQPVARPAAMVSSSSPFPVPPGAPPSPFAPPTATTVVPAAPAVAAEVSELPVAAAGGSRSRCL